MKLHAKLKLNLPSHVKTRAKRPEVLIALLMQLQHGALKVPLAARLNWQHDIALDTKPLWLCLSRERLFLALSSLL